MSLYGLRAASSKYLTGRCTIKRGTHPDVTTVATDVPGLLRPTKGETREVVVANGEKVGLQGLTVRIDSPVDVRRDDVIEFTTSRDDTEDRWFRVLLRLPNEMVTTRLVHVEEIV